MDERLSAIELEFDLLEASEKPLDVVDFYLQKFLIVAGHLAEIAEYFHQQAPVWDIRGMLLFPSLHMCLERLGRPAGSDILHLRCQPIWEPHERMARDNQNWPDDPTRRTLMAYIQLISAATILGLYGSRATIQSLGIERSANHYAGMLPIPIDLKLSLHDQASLVRQNLQWAGYLPG
jgi:hypothetical protein